MDTAVFLEYLPSSKQWPLTALAFAGFLGWGFLISNPWNCSDAASCTKANNWGWRYTMFTGGALVFVMSVLRVTVIKYLATTYNRPCPLTKADPAACGTVISAHSKKRFSVGETLLHIRGFFSNKKMSSSTTGIFLSWTQIGLAYPTFYVFLPTYLATKGVIFHRTHFERWRNYALTNISGIPGPIVAGFMCNTKLGRKYTMAIGAMITTAFFSAYTAVQTSMQDLTLTCVIAFCINIYYGTL
ncbi:Major facilitator-type transporter hxnZ [Colletotrichum aenigma]|uniref:Major facilitator-type transporter hxnZ n=1 Tax=Colletotrichum aenigma TaxID=1215731 RepID=UPI0018729331|nr:Major facilitator-type transporter hxnZ [Colletotrichum aenigma]KAF5517444.1 Major facilitator-type transporter hxnZ [Colletotrichum aenigma]